MEFDESQENALRAIQAWLAAKDRPFFYLAGYAGTGKTTVANKLVEGRKAVYGAYTGKAADVMAGRGCTGATTIHRLIYTPRGGDNDPAVKALREEVERLSRQSPLPRSELSKTLERLAAARARAPGRGFELYRDNPDIAECDLIVIDEVSMVGDQMMTDLMSFGKPILVLGDPGQLPPVKGEGFFTHRTPDVVLTEVHRQQDGSGVLDLATMIRNGKRPKLGNYGTSSVVKLSDVQKLPRQHLMEADQILCGYNVTKNAINAKMRGRDAPVLPVEGDKLVCLRNNHDRGFYNGSTMIAAGDAWEQGRRAFVRVDKDGEEEAVEMDRAAIAGAGAGNDFDLISLDYAWALTCHKAQGSQWEKVLVVDESSVARDNARAWLYTAVTRAQDRVVLALAD